MATPQPQRPPTREPYSVRLTPAERRLIESAALARAMKVSEYIRARVTAAARHDLVGD